MTYRQLLAEHFKEVRICEGAEKCRLRWADKDRASDGAHRRGVVDAVGIIHWTGWDRQARVRGIYQFLRLVALAVDGRMRREPDWLRLYHASVWATKTLRERFHRLAHIEWSADDRQRSWRLAHRLDLGPQLGLADRDWLAYRDWVARGLATLPKTRRKYLRRPVTTAEVDGWATMQQNGATFEDISRRYKRAPKVIWHHLAKR